MYENMNKRNTKRRIWGCVALAFVAIIWANFQILLNESDFSEIMYLVLTSLLVTYLFFGIFIAWRIISIPEECEEIFDFLNGK